MLLLKERWTIRESGVSFDPGHIILKHPGGGLTRYGHVSPYNLPPKGKKIRGGQQISKTATSSEISAVGDKGGMAPHLHFAWAGIPPSVLKQRHGGPVPWLNDAGGRSISSSNKRKRGGIIQSDNFPAVLHRDEMVTPKPFTDRLMHAFKSPVFDLFTDNPQFTAQAYTRALKEDAKRQGDTFNVTINAEGVSDPDYVADLVTRNLGREQRRRDLTRTL